MACTRHIQTAAHSQSVILPNRVSDVENIYWLPDGRWIAQTQNEHLWVHDPHTEEWQEISLPSDSHCLRTYYVLYGVLPDGRAKIGKVCTGSWTDEYGVCHSKDFDMALNVDTEELEELINFEHRAAAGTTWRPDMKRGVFMTGYGFSTLYWTDGDTIEPLPITLTDNGRSWYLPDSVTAYEEYLTNPNYDSLRTPSPVGEVNGVKWSPTGDRIAFWATLETIGRNYGPLEQKRWNLYVMDVDTMQVETVLEDIIDGGGGGWSPDGRWFAAGTRRGKHNPAGLWMLSLKTGEVVALDSGIFGEPSWSPDGGSLLVTRCTDDTCGKSEVRLYDVGSVLDRLEAEQ
jgi:WD40 repeat protein